MQSALNWATYETQVWWSKTLNPLPDRNRWRHDHQWQSQSPVRDRKGVLFCCAVLAVAEVAEVEKRVEVALVLAKTAAAVVAAALQTTAAVSPTSVRTVCR